MSQASQFGMQTSGPADGVSVAARVNASLDALKTSNSGTTEPTYREAGTVWLDTASATAYKVKIRGTSDWRSFIEFNPAASGLRLTGLATGSVSAPSIVFDGDPDTGIFRPAAGQVALVTNGGARLTATNSGVTVNGQVATSSVSMANTGYLQFLDSAGLATNGAVIANDSSNRLLFNMAGTSRMALDTSGNVLIGKTTASAGQAGMLLTMTSNTGYMTMTKGASGVRSMVEFYDRGTPVGAISVGDTGTSFVTSSDYRLKDAPEDLTDSGAFIDALRPVTFTWKTNGAREAGFIAHEFQEVSPTSVVGEKDAVRVVDEYDEEGNVIGTKTVPIYQSMQASSPEVIANIVAELKSVRARLAELEQAAAQPA